MGSSKTPAPTKKLDGGGEHLLAKEETRKKKMCKGKEESQL